MFTQKVLTRFAILMILYFVIFLSSLASAQHKSDFEIRGKICQNLYIKRTQKVIFDDSICRRSINYEISPNQKHMFVSYMDDTFVKYLDVFSLPDVQFFSHLNPIDDVSLYDAMRKGRFRWTEGDNLLLTYGCGSPCYNVRIFSVEGKELNFLDFKGTYYGLSPDRRFLLGYSDMGDTVGFPIQIFDLLQRKKLYESDMGYIVKDYSWHDNGSISIVHLEYIDVEFEDVDDFITENRYTIIQLDVE